MDLESRSAKSGLEYSMTAGYTLEGDTLKVCYDSGEVWGRPKTLVGAAPGHVLLVFRRAKR